LNYQKTTINNQNATIPPQHQLYLFSGFLDLGITRITSHRGTVSTDLNEYIRDSMMTLQDHSIWAIKKYTWQFFVTQPFWETVHLRVCATSVEERGPFCSKQLFFCLLFLYRMLILYLTFSHEIFFCWTSLISIFLAVLFKPFSHPPRFGQTNHAYDHCIFGVHLKRPWDTGNSQEICCMGRL